MVKSVGIKASSKYPSKPKTKSTTNRASSSSSKNKDASNDAGRPTKKARVEIGGATVSGSGDGAVKVKPKAKEEEKKPLKSALKNSNAKVAASTVVEPAREKEKEVEKGTVKAKKQDLKKQPSAAAASKAKGKRKAEVEVEGDAEPAQKPTHEIPEDAEMHDDSTPATASKTKGAAKSKPKKSKEAPAPPLPRSFKVVAGSYEKLLYGLEGTVTLSSSSSSAEGVEDSKATDGDEDMDGANEKAEGSTSKSLYTFTLKPIFIFPAHVSCIKSVAASPQGGKWLATGSADEIIKVWDLKRRKEVGGLMHHQGSITTLTFPSRSHLLSASEDGTLALFRARDWSVLRTLKGHKGRVNALAVHPSGKVALSVGKDGVLRMWDLMRGKGVGSTRLGGKKVEGVEGSGWREGEKVVWAVGGGVFAVQSGQGVEVYATNMDVLHNIRHASRIHDVKFVLPVGSNSTSSTSELLLVGAEDKKTTVYEIGTSAGEQTTKPRIVAELVGHTNRIKAIETINIALPSSSPQSQEPQSTTLACTVSSDGFIHIYDLSPISSVLSSSTSASPGDAGPLKLEPVARYDTNKTRLTCVTVADGETDVVVGGKRKRGEEVDNEGKEDEEDEGRYGKADESGEEDEGSEGSGSDEDGDEDEDENEGEDEDEGEYEVESD
ncbi:WD40-repeat-containing domain protein [Panaeolus papilionaceus]|nr:WD40-repeat-containing domain protein [Panaeolus papilionaceus]